MGNSYSDKTSEYISNLNLEDRKKLGQYMTPQFLGQRMAKLFTLEEGKETKVLDPAVGTGELLLAFKKVFPQNNVSFHGWDIDPNMLTIFKNNVPEGESSHRSLYDEIPDQLLNSFDKIIGNPPYFEIKKTDVRLEKVNYEIAQESGRLNVYALFFEYALKLLKVGGELVFLVPPSMNNGAFFALTRKHILNNGYIKNLEILRDNHFVDAQTSTQIIHIIKTNEGFVENLRRSEKFVFDFNEVVPQSPKKLPLIFTGEKQTISESWENRKSLYELGFMVKTGSTIWNKQKNLFTTVEDDDTGCLIYSKDISKNNTLVFSDKLSEKRFLPKNCSGSYSQPSIIVNRIVGSLNNPQLRYAYVDLPYYFTENHVNVITSVSGGGLSLSGLLGKFKNNEKMISGYLKALTGNTQLSATELQFLIPF